LPDPGQFLRVSTELTRTRVNKGYLGILKAQLRQALKDVEQQETLLAETLKPQTLAEVDNAEKKLKEALEELSRRRAELQKADKKG
jgi:DNA repair exonuclease SbcCD ATPase subunit